jgi:hypothetical protein
VDCANVDCYRIKSYVNSGGGATFSQCGNYLADTINPWNGTLPWAALCAPDILWVVGAPADPYSFSINGMASQTSCACTPLGTDATRCGAYLYFSAAEGCWILDVNTTDQDTGYAISLWRGTQSSASPVGIYTRTAGCDTTTTLEIEACPGATAITVPTSYEICGYVDGALTPCASCDNATTEPAFDGVFDDYMHFPVQGTCIWIDKVTVSMDGKRLGYTPQLRYARADVVDAIETFFLDHFSLTIDLNCKWFMWFGCDDDKMIWIGSKANGSTPVGDYARLAGCDETTSLTIAETGTCP